MTNQEKKSQSLFERNLMPDLIKEYGEAGKKKIPLNLEKIRKPPDSGLITDQMDTSHKPLF
ncbi:MAG TPA: hypothetical protein VE130_07810 [Nitrososphaeraceae archaeon]|nr:hypothetical protein [Nitrososphaeraceae archaeon]